MSIINQMHQDIQQVKQEHPILTNMPKKQSRQKAFLLVFIILLISSSVVLSYLILTSDRVDEEREITALKKADTPVVEMAESRVDSLAEQTLVKKVAATSAAQIKHRQAVIAKSVKVEDKKNAPKLELEKRVQAVSTIPVAKKSITAALPLSQQSENNNALDIKTVKLSPAQLAQIHLQEADKAQANGALELTVKKKQQALVLQPTLNDVRKSLALYYYGQGEITKAIALLKNGAVISPEYSDFNLMLSRIALKEGDELRAYLYLEQHPPEVAGHLDYYVSHAILAQKLRKYEQSERLYASLLSLRPNNGRWRMSLAIAQDKQQKIALALSNYKNALLQPDLSSKAKAYINQRLTYLERK